MEPGMIAGIKEMIARCMGRMRAGACATCDNRGFCPAGHWQQAFGPPASSARDDSLGALFERVAALFARPSAAPRCFKGEVEAVIEPMLKAGTVSVDRAASELGMSRQTLYRRLKGEGTTFEELLEAKRRQLAIRYLGVERLPVKATAYRLGFSDPAAFSRAFKRWTGTSPSLFRQGPLAAG
jgi:AraC-like DNA-binding protein